MAESKTQEGIVVAVRLKPLAADDGAVWRPVVDNNAVQLTNTDGEPLGGASAFFQYDRVFGPEADTRALFDGIAQRVVDGVVEGVNGTVFAYGQTSSGKTFTMQGAGALGSVPGVIHMAAERMFAQMGAASEREFLVRVSYLEIYNENLRDLLADGDAPAAAAIREDPRRGVFVEANEKVIPS